MRSTSSVRTFRSPAPEEPHTKKPKKPGSHKFSRNLLPWFIALVLLAASIFMYAQYRTAKHKLQTSNPVVMKQQAQDVVSRVSKLIILPKNQTPTIATVVHAEKLKDQAFFADAKDGDKLLVYKQTKQAILYRPSTNQIVTVSTINAAPDSTAQQ